MFLGRERKEEKRDRLEFVVDAAKALMIALGDSETSYFMKTNFSCPERNPKILSHKWLSTYDSGYKWNVEIIEKIPDSSQQSARMMNIAIVEVDSSTGKIIRRHFFKNILPCEHQKIIDLLDR